MSGKGRRRKELRESLAAQRDAILERRQAPILVGFDFDCTLTVRHFYKAFAWGYAQGAESMHPHCRAFFDYCRQNDIVPRMTGQPDAHEDLMAQAVEDFCRQAGEDAFREAFREVFLGGDERIRLVAAWLRRMKEARVDFAVVTAGTSCAVMRALTATPEWLPFFPSNRVWDISQGRHAVSSVAAQKALILRDLCPAASRIVLVDDALERDPPPGWVLEAASVETFSDLPYEGGGVDERVLQKLERSLLQ